MSVLWMTRHSQHRHCENLCFYVLADLLFTLTHLFGERHCARRSQLFLFLTLMRLPLFIVHTLLLGSLLLSCAHQQATKETPNEVLQAKEDLRFKLAKLTMAMVSFASLNLRSSFACKTSLGVSFVACWWAQLKSRLPKRRVWTIKRGKRIKVRKRNSWDRRAQWRSPKRWVRVKRRSAKT